MLRSNKIDNYYYFALFLGTVFSPDDALKIGLVDKVVPENQLMTSVRECLKESASLEGEKPIVHWCVCVGEIKMTNAAP